MIISKDGTSNEIFHYFCHPGGQSLWNGPIYWWLIKFNHCWGGFVSISNRNGIESKGFCNISIENRIETNSIWQPWFVNWIVARFFLTHVLRVDVPRPHGSEFCRIWMGTSLNRTRACVYVPCGPRTTGRPSSRLTRTTESVDTCSKKWPITMCKFVLINLTPTWIVVTCPDFFLFVHFFWLQDSRRPLNHVVLRSPERKVGVVEHIQPRGASVGSWSALCYSQVHRSYADVLYHLFLLRWLQQLFRCFW